jgi:hypothetical protein
MNALHRGLSAILAGWRESAKKTKGEARATYTECANELAVVLSHLTEGAGEAVAWLYEASNGCDPEVWATFADTHRPTSTHRSVRNVRPLFAHPAQQAMARVTEAMIAEATETYADYTGKDCSYKAMRAALTAALAPAAPKESQS